MAVFQDVSLECSSKLLSCRMLKKVNVFCFDTRARTRVKTPFGQELQFLG